MVFKTLAAVLPLIFYAAVAAAQSYRGDITYYNTGLGACGWYNQDTDFIVALPPAQYANGDRCGQHIHVLLNGQEIDAMVADLCPGCEGNSIDLSPAAFEALASLDVGRTQAEWMFV